MFSHIGNNSNIFHNLFSYSSLYDLSNSFQIMTKNTNIGSEIIKSQETKYLKNEIYTVIILLKKNIVFLNINLCSYR